MKKDKKELDVTKGKEKVKSLFEINSLNNLTKNNFCYEMKNFYKNPDKICDLFNKERPYVHKWAEKNSLNTVDFIDCRHAFISEDFKKTEKKIYDFLKIDSSNITGLVGTNFTKFFNIKDSFKNNYWWPHIDSPPHSYNCIVYLNKSPCDGTNIYVKLNNDENHEEAEHSNPWQSKNKYALLQNIKAEYNKLVIFRADMYHGLAYNEHRFKNRFRKNQVFFI